MLRGMVLSPTNIYWMKNSGTETLIAKKADYLNFNLIEKLVTFGQKLLVEEDFVVLIQYEFLQFVNAHRSELHFKEKITWRNRLFELILRSKVTQNEISQCAWGAWSELSDGEVKFFIDFDIDIFKRSLNISSSIILCALLLGFYQDEFLKKLYTKTMRQQMRMQKIEFMDKLKSNMDLIRVKNTLVAQDKEYLGKVFPNTLTWAGERIDGSGINSFDRNELNELELLMIALEQHYSYLVESSSNIFDSIMDGSFKCDEKILRTLRRALCADNNISLIA